MRLKVSFNIDVPPVDFSTNTVQATPLELLVSDLGSPQSRNRALQMYIQSLDYLFRGVTNMVSSDIKSISVEKGWFGALEKLMDSHQWGAFVDKSFVVIYDISRKSIVENMYVADSIAVNARNDQGVNPIWIKELLQPSGLTATQNLQNAIAILSEYVEGYNFVWGFRGKQEISILDSEGKQVNTTEIKDDETFILTQLIELLTGKGVHMGVFIVNCQGFSDRILEAFVKTAKDYFGDTCIFFYNVDPNSKVERVQVQLPNFISMKRK